MNPVEKVKFERGMVDTLLEKARSYDDVYFRKRVMDMAVEMMR